MNQSGDKTTVGLTSEEVLSLILPPSVSYGYGGHLVDSNNVDYIDMVSAWGTNILGYGYRRITEAVSDQIVKYSNLGMAGPEYIHLNELLIQLLPCAETIKLVKNGSDATSAAIRLARYVTGREKVLHRGYHGVQDWYMASLQCPGVPSTHYKQIISLTELSEASVKQAFVDHPGEIACLIIDPMLYPIPDRDSMLAISDIVHKEGALLIYDEVVSGFRVATGGAQEMWDVLPDLACYGKAIANGLPLSVLVGRECWMQKVSSINYNLTFAFEAVSIVAAIETINEIVERQVCEDLAQKGRILKKAYSEICEVYGIQSELVGHDCRPQLEFQDHNQYSSGYCHYLVIQELARKRICTYGTFSICYAHTLEDIETIINGFDEALEKLGKTIRPHVSGLSQTQAEVSQATEKIGASLEEENSELKHQLNQTQTELSQTTAEIEWMKSSKFWKMRTLWFSIKRKLRFPIN